MNSYEIEVKLKTVIYSSYSCFVFVVKHINKVSSLLISFLQTQEGWWHQTSLLRYFYPLKVNVDLYDTKQGKICSESNLYVIIQS